MTALSVDIDVPRRDFTVSAAFLALPGRTLAIVGPNGAGKSTLLGSVAGSVWPTRGSVRLGERVLLDADAGTSVPVEQRRLGLVFQDGLLFPHLTVRENVAFSARSRGLGRRRSRAEARYWLERLGAGHLAASHPSALSGGQRQRVALARALAADPLVLLLDEPLAALDVRSRDEIREVLAEHLDDFAGVAVLVTHSAADVAALADDVVVLEEGVVSQRGSLADIQRDPQSRWIRRLVRDLAVD
jgi:molybdate transport system ATP-binding protein